MAVVIRAYPAAALKLAQILPPNSWRPECGAIDSCKRPKPPEAVAKGQRLQGSIAPQKSAAEIGGVAASHLLRPGIVSDQAGKPPDRRGFSPPARGLATPLWIIVLQAFCYGAFTSLQYTSMNTLVYADIDDERTSGASSIASTVQQLSISFGVAAAGLTTGFSFPIVFVQTQMQ